MAEKKKNVKKTSSNKKKTIKKTTTKGKKDKKQENKFDSLIILKIAFYLLVILVIVLAIVVIKKKQETKNDLKANIVIPIVDKEDEAPFSINLRALNASKKEYIFKIVNYSGNKINSEDLKFVIDVQNTTDTKIEMTKYDSKDNLLVDQEEQTIEGTKVPKDEKEDIYYVVKITKAGTLGKDDYVNIKVRSIR